MAIWEWWLALGGVVLLGLQTSISPCMLTTNIAAISYLARKAGHPREVWLSGLLYTLGQTSVYVLLTALILSPIFFGGETVTRFLQTRIHGYLGPLFLVVGVMLLGWVSFNIGGASGEKMRPFADRFGFWSALPLGMVFAMAFCPTSAATFLATLTLASRYQAPLAFPVAFGVGTAIPVFAFAALLAVNLYALGKVYSAIGRIEWWLRTVAGALFLAVGFWLSLRYVYFS